MIKRTLYFGNPAYLRFKDEQLVVILPETSMLPEKDRTITIPIEDIGDTENHEARAAAYYWSELFDATLDFRRYPEGLAPNSQLNYGYAILRAVVARSLVASGLLPTFGIHHHNRYNAYCLADDVMEPYRPFVDKIVVEMMLKEEISEELTKPQKTRLLQIPVLDVTINGRRSPLMLAVQQTTASLAKCFKQEIRRIEYPEFN